jgi:putative ABC transport system ATP-binding protein
MAETPIVRFADVTKTYEMGAITVHALKGISFDVMQGEYISIMGPSGCGKSTLLNILGCLDRPSDGNYFLGGLDVSKMEDDDLSSVRGERLGFIFQSYQLIQQLSVVENIEIPLYYQGWPEEKSREKALEYAERVGLKGRVDHKPMELSGGQQQRVAIARALVNDPIAILADEATGNLDTKTGEEILTIFDELNAQGKTLVMITHEQETAERAKRIIRLRDGLIESDVRL